MTAETLKKTIEKPVAKNGNTTEMDLSEEDLHLKEELTMLIERLQETNKNLYKPAFESLRTLIKSATTSMTSVPKPLKFLRPYYGTLKEIYEKLTSKEHRSMCADIISILGITMSDKPDFKYDSLKFRLLGSDGDIGSWGHEYVRHLTTQIVGMWNMKDLSASELTNENKELQQSYLKLANKIIPYLMNHNAEAEAIDLCLELEELDIIKEYTVESNYERVCLYLTSCIPYLPEPDNFKVLRQATSIYQKFDDIGNAMRFSLRLNDPDLILKLYNDAKVPAESIKNVLANPNSVQRQLAFLLGKQQFLTPYDEAIDGDDTDLPEMLGNTKLSEHFLSLGRELDIMEPKIPEDIYKSHLETVRPSLNAASMDTMRSNLSASYVNGLVNCGFGKEKLLQEDSKEVSWVYKQKDFGKMSTVATLGWVMLWDVECGLTQIDKYFYTNDDYSRAGALLGCGVVNCGVKNECDPALALLSGYVDSTIDALSRASIIGIGVAYAGSMKSEAISKLLPIVTDTSQPKIQKSCLAALSCGMIAVGSLNVEVTSTIIQTMLDRPASHWNNTFSKFMALGLALTCLGRQEDVDVILASLEVVSEPLKSMAHMMCDFCAYAGSGNVLKVQNLLHILSEKYEKEATKEDSKSKKDKKEKSDDKPGVNTRSKKKVNNEAKTTEEPMDTSVGESKPSEDESSFDFLAHQGLAAIGVAVLAMGEEIGLDMAFRMFGHLLRFGELPIKRAVPLALGLCYISNPQLKVLDTLSKFSHDSDSELAYNSILALGLVGAGTNNARLAAMLRQLASFHIRDSQSLFLVRLAQGLVHLGKGTLTLSPWHSDRTLLRPVALAGLLTLLVSCLDTKSTFMGRHDYLMFYITPAIQPRLLMTFDEELKPLPVTVRVGQAVDVVGQAGRPKTLTGFQTHTTPVLLSHGERAELATEEYIPVTKLPLEGFIILAKNPNFDGQA